MQTTKHEKTAPKMQNFLKLRFDLNNRGFIISYAFYEQFKTKLLFLQTSIGNISSASYKSDLKDIIEFIESNNSTTLLGTVDFDRFTKIRDPSNVYLICDDKIDNLLIDIIDQTNIEEIINSLKDYTLILNE